MGFCHSTQCPVLSQYYIQITWVFVTVLYTNNMGFCHSTQCPVLSQYSVSSIVTVLYTNNMGFCHSIVTVLYTNNMMIFIFTKPFPS